MKFGLSEKTLLRMIEVFAQHPKVEEVLIYGSRAKGNYKPSSDIDLTVIAPEMDLSDLHKISLDLDDLLLPYMIDLSLYHHITDPDVLKHVERVGKVFYRREGRAVKTLRKDNQD